EIVVVTNQGYYRGPIVDCAQALSEVHMLGDHPTTRIDDGARMAWDVVTIIDVLSVLNTADDSIGTVILKTYQPVTTLGTQHSPFRVIAEVIRRTQWVGALSQAI